MAKVNGTFYTAQRLRRGTTPVSPEYDGSEGQQPPVNPSVRTTPPVAIRYTSEAEMIADQTNQRSGYLYFDGTNTWWYLGVANGVIGDYQEFGGGGSGLPPVDGSYASQAAMIADQGAQMAQYIYFDGTQYWEYLGTTVGTIADYRVFGSLWTTGTGFIYRNSAVAIGTNTIPSGATLGVQSLTATDAFKYVQFLNNAGIEQFSITQQGNFSFICAAGRRVQIDGVTSTVGDFLRLNSTGTATSQAVRLIHAGATSLTILGNGTLIFANSANFLFGTVQGTKIANATNQKLAFWNKTPIIQPTTGITGATRVGGGGATITDTDTFGGYTVAQLAAILINTGLTA